MPPSALNTALNTAQTPELPALNTCFEDSRRLTGPNRYFASTGAVLDAPLKSLGIIAHDPAAHKRWRALVRPLCEALGWSGENMIQPHASGTLFAIAAPFDQLFTATEVNEWAWEEASNIFVEPRAGPSAEPRAELSIKGNPPFERAHVIDGSLSAAARYFQTKATAEKNTALVALHEAAHQHHLPIFIDDTHVSIGAGNGSRTWPLAQLPAPYDVQWKALHTIPTAMVTGSNGKTTTVRLLAALLAAGEIAGEMTGELAGKTKRSPTINTAEKSAARTVGYCCTEGVLVGGQQIESGDYSGPAGARTVLRHPRVAAAVLETARGGILRRGLAVASADVAIITNVSADHFGEYGIDSVADVADVKLVVARTLGNKGTLVLNADDATLISRASAVTCPIALFSLDDHHPDLRAARAANGMTCGMHNGELILFHHGAITNLGSVADMPLTLGGAAQYNIANIAAATLAATVLGVDAKTIATQLMRFGRRHQDNPGRLERWNIDSVTILIDYAHNPDGLAKLMQVSQTIQGKLGGRLGLLLGQAGNRVDAAITELARVAATFKPDIIVFKEITTMLRGRQLGEVPALLRASLAGLGYADEHLHTEPDEMAAARYLLRWAKRGDVVVLPIHQAASRTELVALLDSMAAPL